MTDEIWPAELRVRPDRKALTVVWSDGRSDTIEAELLRVESPSAEVQGHGPGEKVVVTGKREVAIKTVEPVGAYAVRLAFSDGHSTGIYSWSYLREVAANRESLWAAYRDALARRGLERG